ncbi:uncharacterized protein ARMOST_21080 [Armillaria ostoyae]|uniref:Uncharacterized protein n=1 Tax=Armillaria ostoyae TaxID=47428 RepID=A0A284S944_ARMOS|nr:uncharacterized protein ARMOST_21080 [Armillaria ostoyae]
MEVAKSRKARAKNEQGEEEEEDDLGEMRAPVKVTGRRKAGAQSHQPRAVDNIAPHSRSLRDEEPNWKGRRFVFEDEVGQQRAFKVNGNILFLAHEFQRRQTFVASVEPVNEKGKALPPLVLKFQWPSRNSPATESQLI